MKRPRTANAGPVQQGDIFSGFEDADFTLPTLPPPRSLEAEALGLFMKGQRINHADFIELHGSWRLAAYVRALVERGWPIVSQRVAAPSWASRYRTIAVYFITAADRERLREVMP